MNIAYYISSFGLGHTSRAIPIIDALSRNHTIHIKCSELSLKSINANMLGNKKIRLYDQINDLWLQYNGIKPAINKSIKKAYDFFIKLEKNVVDKESNFINKNNINFIISDIVPCLDKIGKRYDVPVVGISNFDWGKLYEHLYNKYGSIRLKKIAEILSSSYESFDLQIALPLNKGLLTKKEYKEVGFFARQPTRTKEQMLELLQFKDDRKIMFTSFGMSLVFPNKLLKNILNNIKNYYLIASNSSNIKYSNFFTFVPQSDFKTQDYFAISDIYLGKPGWGTLSECYYNRIPVILAEFEENLEWRVLIEEMKKIYPNTRSFKMSSIQPDEILNYIQEFETLNQDVLRKERKKAGSISQKSINKIVSLIESFDK
ncbi:MAG: glycosyltransferase family protein [Candidatus Heimdallarchaeaceae archaeon]